MTSNVPYTLSDDIKPADDTIYAVREVHYDSAIHAPPTVSHARYTLRLNPATTQVIWLGSGQLLRQVSICHVPVLFPRVKPVESARDLASL